MSSLVWTSTRTKAAELDHADTLARVRACYDLRSDVIHLDGDSVGADSRGGYGRLRRFIQHRWDVDSARARTDHDSREEARRAAHRLAPLIGGGPDEITISDSVSMSLFRALVTCTRLRPDRSVLLAGESCMSVDRCLARSAAESTGTELVMLDEVENLDRLLDERVAAVALSHVDLYDGAVRDAATITDRVHRAGALALWELSHSAGAVRVDVNSWGADFAIGSGHKYLGGGPGAPAYGFVAREHHADIAGMRPRAAGGVRLPDSPDVSSAGAPPSMSISAFADGLAVLDGVQPAELEAKTAGLIDLFLSRVRAHPHGDLRIERANGGRDHGSALVVLCHPRAGWLARNLFARGVLVDCVEPNLLRLGFCPSWLSYMDVWDAADALLAALQEIDHPDPLTNST